MLPRDILSSETVKVEIVGATTHRQHIAVMERYQVRAARIWE